MDAAAIALPLIQSLRRGLEQITTATSDNLSFQEYMTCFGWEVQVTESQMEDIRVFMGIKPVVALLSQLAEQIENPGSSSEQSIAEIVEGIIAAVDSIKTWSSGAGVAALPNPFNSPAFWADFPGDLIGNVSAAAFRREVPALFAILAAFGIVDRQVMRPSGANRLAYVKINFQWDLIGNLFTDPVGLLNESFRWDVPGKKLDHAKLLHVIAILTKSSGLMPRLRTAPDNLLDLYYAPGNGVRNNISILHLPFLWEIGAGFTSSEIGFSIMPITPEGNTNVEPNGFMITPTVRGAITGNLDPDSPWQLKAKINGLDNGAFRFEFRPDGAQLKADPGITEVEAELSLQGNFSSSPWIMIGSENSHRLEFEGVFFSLGIKGNINDPELYFKLGTGDGPNPPKIKVVIQGGDGDGFIQSVIGSEPQSIDFSGYLSASSKHGIGFSGNVGFELELPLHLDLGIIEIQKLQIGFRASSDNGLSIPIGVTTKVMLGPIEAAIENMGVQLLLSPKAAGEKSGIFGDLDTDWEFKPPNGVGLSVDAGVVKGGGYLFFDYDREEYAGALELVFSEWIALKAVGLVTTRLPDGSKGFSMVIIISVEFGSGLQLGFGFTLLGVGGILGINRTVNIDALSAGVVSGAIESVMFPENVVANAPKIISDLRQFFPAKKDQFLIGPMAKIGYGTPTLISLSLGLIIEFPDVNITILGVLKVALPTEEAAVIKLQVNFLGRIEPSNKLLWFYAVLFDSRILFITLEGGMGLLVNWGDNSNFVVSVGGFHPRFNPPPLPFPAIPRIAVNILNESAARIRIEGYFAVTSNTVQFGARAELFFGFSAINVQGHLGFDALFQFNPFYFIFEFSLGLSVKVFGFGLFSIGVSGLLEGPAKWHIEGTAKWKITWFGPTIRIKINETWGEEKQTELPPIEAFPLLEREFAAITNWEAVIPKQSSLLVALRKLGDTESAPDSDDMDTRPLVLHPMGTLRISQRKIPLKLKLDKIGSQQPSDVNEFSVSANLNGGGELAQKKVREKFARGEFQELDQAKKLSSPAFEKYESGMTITAKGDALKTSMAVKRIIRYETIIIDNLFKRKAIAFFKQLQLIFSTVFATLFAHFLNGNAVTRSVLSFKVQKQLQPNKEVITIKANGYSVAFNATNKPVDAVAAQFESQAEAMDYLQKQKGVNAKAAQGMHVIPNTEINQAA